MKRLILMRHAKSDWDNHLPDIKRPLSSRGEREAPIMGKFLRSNGVIPELVISSPSQRTRETFGYLKQEIKDRLDVVYDETIYENEPQEIVSLVKKTSDTITTLMILGHNPSMEELAQLFSGLSLNKFCDKFSTSSVVLLEFDIEKWSDIDTKKGKLVFYKSPKNL